MGKVRPVRKDKDVVGEKTDHIGSPIKRMWDLKKGHGEGYMVAGLGKVEHMIGKLEGMMVMAVVVGGWGDGLLVLVAMVVWGAGDDKVERLVGVMVVVVGVDG